MVEQAIYFALGFCAASLVALAVLPAFWRRALRLTGRRLEAQMAMSPAQITAARDQLRAEFAVAVRRAEIERDAALARRHDELAEIGRGVARAHQLEQALAASRAEAEALTRTIADHVAAAATSRDAFEALQASHAALRSEHDALAAERDRLVAAGEAAAATASAQNAELLSFETLADGLRARSRDLETMLATSRNEVAARSRALRALEQTHRETSAEAAELTRRLEAAEAEAATQAAQRASDAERLETTLAALAAAEEQASALGLAEARAATALAAETTHRQELEERLVKQREGARQTTRDLARSIDRLTTEKSLAEGALEQVRAERARLQAELRRSQTASGGKTVRNRPNGRNDNGAQRDPEAGSAGVALGTPEPDDARLKTAKVALV
jgi:hypothetical protein